MNALLLALAVSAELPGFVALPRQPSAAEFECANDSDEWVVSMAGGRLRVAPLRREEAIEPLPFGIAPQPDRVGDRRLARVADGWLVGFDGGEFGGGLWWFGEDGKESRRLRPPPGAPVHANDVYRAENVVGFSQESGRLLVFMGLDHLGGESGRIFEARRGEGGWLLEPFAILDRSPAAWIATREHVLVLTGSGLWRAARGRPAEHLHAADIGLLYPTSLVQGPDGALYAGMRRYVLRLEAAGAKWNESWWVRSDCMRVALEDGECRCHP